MQNQPAPAAHATRTACPWSAAVAEPAAADGVQADTELALPLHRRVVAQFANTAGGGVELRLYCGDQEISFDEPELFAFGQTLAQQSRFTAHAATTWGPGYAWPQVQPLLQELLQAGVLRRVPAGQGPAPHHPVTGSLPAPLPAGPCERPQLWSDGAGCEPLMQQLTGRPMELGWLEMVLPVFRVAHAALDADGRQVGEANVFPKALRLDVPTRWRACIYPGTRYQTGRPMNVSALKAMRAHWPVMMRLLAAVRAAYLRRFELDGRQWTVGQLERLATCVLALPTYLLMRADAPVANGQLHPALAGLFRVTDGLRMTLHQMLFVPIAEPTLKPDAALTSAEILAYAERNYSLHSEHGVCAGPQSMIEEFLAVLVDGAGPVQADASGDASSDAADEAAIAEALRSIEPAIDYALLGLRVHAAVFSLWPRMARSYEELAAITQRWAEHGGVAVQVLSLQLQHRVAGLRTGTYVANEAWRADREAVYAEMYAQCGRGLEPGRARCGWPADDESLTEQLKPQLSCSHALADRRLEALLQSRLGRPGGSDRADVRRLRDGLMAFFLQLQTVLRVAGAAQAQLNTLLGRAQPLRDFDSADLDITHLLQGNAERRVPYLIDDIDKLLQLRVRITAEALQVEDTSLAPEHGVQPAAAAPRTESTGMVPAVARASRTHP